MKLKIILITALSACTLGGVALAQDQNPPEPPPHHGGHGGNRRDPMERLTETLNLTPEQKTKVQPIVDEAKPKIEAIHREAMEKSKAVMDDAAARIRPLLTPDQQKKLDEAKNERRGGGREGRRGHRGGDASGADDGNG